MIDLDGDQDFVLGSVLLDRHRQVVLESFRQAYGKYKETRDDTALIRHDRFFYRPWP